MATSRGERRVKTPSQLHRLLRQGSFQSSDREITRNDQDSRSDLCVPLSECVNPFVVRSSSLPVAPRKRPAAWRCRVVVASFSIEVSPSRRCFHAWMAGQ
jgi:hypothetical protein